MSQTVETPEKPVTEFGAVSKEERLVAWLRTNQKALTAGVGILALIVAVSWFLAASSKRKEAFARAALEQAWGAGDAGNLTEAATELQRIVTSYGGTEAAMEARLSLNQTRLLNNQAQLAVDDLRAFLESNPPARVAARGNMLLGTALENAGQSAEAASAYQRAADLAELDHLKADALLGAARAHLAAGQTDQARTALQAIVERYKESAAFSVAEVRLGELNARS